jgi:hypothetical protein
MLVGSHSGMAPIRAWPPFGHGPPSGDDEAVDELPSWLPRRIEALQGMRVRCVAVGQSHSCVVTDEGHVYTWVRQHGCPRPHGL